MLVLVDSIKQRDGAERVVAKEVDQVHHVDLYTSLKSSKFKYLFEETVGGGEELIEEHTLLRGFVALLVFLVDFDQPLRLVQAEDHCEGERIPQAVLLLKNRSAFEK